jgi:hypothetical protein
MMSQTMSQVAGIMRWASERAARFSFELDPVRSSDFLRDATSIRQPKIAIRVAA